MKAKNDSPVDVARIPVTHEKLREPIDVYSKLREMILSFELYPGSRVTETALAEFFHVSRTPVREALLRLEQEGHLSIRSKQGCFIRQIDIEELTEYYKVRVILEEAAVEHACERMPDEEIKELIKSWTPDKRLKKILPKVMEERDETFHLTLAAGGGNSVLVNYLRDIGDHIRVIRRLDFTEPDRIGATIREHHQILLAILSRDVDKAKNLIKKHIQRSENYAKTITLTQLARMRAFSDGKFIS